MKNKNLHKLARFILIILVCFFLTPLKSNVYASSFTYDGLEFKYAHDALWVKVFYHDCSTGEFFTSFEELLNTNSVYKYSILGKIDEFKTENTYEFLLEYPELNGYNRWTQTSNPTTTVERVDGYNPISISWNTYWWHGLCASNPQYSFIDGSVGHANWLYAIGSKQSWGTATQMPGPEKPLSKVYLWQRVDGNYNLYDEFEKSIKAGNIFAKVFSQNTRGDVYFSNNNEALSTSNSYNYSILNQLDTFFINGKYEFYLEYPEISGYNRWSQTSNPINTTESIIGYTPISISWSGNYWKGLCASNSGSSFLDGDVGHGNWCYAIACYYNKWINKTSSGYSSFPGPYTSSGLINVSLCNLYARVDDGKDLVEPTITTNIVNDTLISKDLEINISDNYNLNYLKVYELSNLDGANTIEINNANSYNTTYKIENNGLYIVETKDVNGNTNRSSLYINDIDNETPIISNATFNEDNINFNINMEIGSTIEKFDKIKYFVSKSDLEENTLDINNFVDLTPSTLNLQLSVEDNHNKYLYLYAYNKNTLKSNLYKIQLVANVIITFKNEKDEVIISEEVPYNSIISSYLPIVKRNGYSLSWNEDVNSKIIEDKEIKTIWNINDDHAAYSIIIPKTLILNGDKESNFSSCDYSIKFKGEIGKDVNVSVIPNKIFYLKDPYGIKDSILVDITQPTTIINREDILLDEYKTLNGFIQTKEKLTAGNWYGTFNFDIKTNLINNVN